MTITPRLLTCREVAKAYRIRREKVSAAFKAGRLPGRQTGRAIFVSAKRAEELFGVDGGL